MKDGILLIVVALIASALAWAFWHYLGQNAFAVFVTVAFIVLWGENYRLRKKLKEKLKSE